MDPNDLRNELDSVEQELVLMLNRRAELAVGIQQAERAASDSRDNAPLHRPDDDARIIRMAISQSKGPLPDSSLEAIYREILSATRALQRPPRVAYLGPLGTFSHEAALRQFGRSAVYIPCRNFADIFQETERQAADYGIVPVENSTEGAVTPPLDRLVDTDLLVCAAIEQPVRHFLLSHGKLDQITRVVSHPQALAQCRRWLADNLPNAVTVDATSTAAAAQQAVDSTTAAISTETAAELYGVPILVSRIEDVATNVTRFFVIGSHMGQRTGHDRTAIVFSVEDKTGALYSALKWLADNGINLSRIESRPSRRRLWEYVFFVELVGHPEDERVERALTGLRQSSAFVRVLGAWPT